VVACLNPIDGPCAIKSCCVLRRALARARDAFIEVLDGYSLADLVEPQASLRALLAIDPAHLARPAGGVRKRTGARH
jgi:Rrf2 family nitric oxide-sensitive transcriptional repressor